MGMFHIHQIQFIKKIHIYQDYAFRINQNHMIQMLKAFEVTLKIGKIPVFSLPHIEQHVLSKVEQCKKFRDYVQKLNHLEKGVEISKIQILGVEMFGENVGFVNMRTITQKDGFKLPGYLFLRGHAVAILMLVNDKVLLVEQYRVPVQQTMLQAPAGMIDESGDFVGVAAKQIEQQTSIKITKDQLKPLGSFYPSCGGCDQEIFIYYCQVNLPEQQLKKIEEKIHGEGEHERIRIRLINYDHQLLLKSKDAKLIYAVFAYQALTKNKTSNPNL